MTRTDTTRHDPAIHHHPSQTQYQNTHIHTKPRLSLHALWAEAPGLMLDTLHRSAEAPFAIAITTGYLLGDALLVAYSILPPAVQRKWLGWEYGPISAPVSTLAHHLVGQ